MPIYEYQCSDCQYEFEQIQKMSEAPVKTCPQCSKDTVVRLISPAGFQLKGSGWYVTDFKDKDKNKAKPKSSTAEHSTESKKETTPTSTKKGESD